MRHSPKAVANYFLKKAWKEKFSLTPIQVIKLVYIAHGWTLAVLGDSLIHDEVEAWQYGPVIPALYREFKSFGNKPIDKLAKSRLREDEVYVEAIAEFSEKEKEIMDAVWDKYGNWKGFQLSDLTHKKGTPWDIAYNKNNGPGKTRIVISKDLIKKHYSKLAEAENANG
ncbi:MAG: Panacea domain-containing protein [Nitrospinales bacterium]